MGGRAQTQAFAAGWGSPWAGPQDTVRVECWSGGRCSLSLVPMGVGILGPGPLGPKCFCGGPFLLAQVREKGGGTHTGHGAAPSHLQDTVAKAPASSRPLGRKGAPEQLGGAGVRRGRAGPGLGKAFSLQPGRLKKVQGIGWYLDEKNLAQVSTNLLDFEVTALHTVYEETCREAKASGRRPPGWGDPPGEKGGVSPSGRGSPGEWGPFPTSPALLSPALD